MSVMKKILIIDDDHDALDLLEVILFRDYDLSTAVNGFEGLAKAQEIKPDCILTDIMMPVMDGIGFINNLRKHPEFGKTPVIAVTSFTDKHPVKSLLNIGFSDVVSKPFRNSDVLKTVRSVLGDHVAGKRKKRQS
jgi:CheY-like chemotaxis protein